MAERFDARSGARACDEQGVPGVARIELALEGRSKALGIALAHQRDDATAKTGSRKPRPEGAVLARELDSPSSAGWLAS